MIAVGDRVRPIDADAPGSIPAYRELVGTVVAVDARDGGVRVHWDCDKAMGLPAEGGCRRPALLQVVP